jgi:AbiV family abortive infection protein
MKPYHIRVKLLEEFKENAFKNAVRLFRDATLLYTHSSYPSSYALAVAAYEEIGKVHVIDRACDAMCMNPEAIDDIYEMYIKSSRTKNHKHKQRQAMFDANDAHPATKNTLREFVYSGRLEQTRQQALYVEMADDTIQTPNRVTSQKTFALIKLCHAAFHGTRDLGFSGFTAESTVKSEWLATRELGEVDSAMQTCIAHNSAIKKVKT